MHAKFLECKVFSALTITVCISLSSIMQRIAHKYIQDIYFPLFIRLPWRDSPAEVTKWGQHFYHLRSVYVDQP